MCSNQFQFLMSQILSYLSQKMNKIHEVTNLFPLKIWNTLRTIFHTQIQINYRSRYFNFIILFYECFGKDRSVNRLRGHSLVTSQRFEYFLNPLLPCHTRLLGLLRPSYIVSQKCEPPFPYLRDVIYEQPLTERSTTKRPFKTRFSQTNLSSLSSKVRWEQLFLSTKLPQKGVKFHKINNVF